MRRVALALLCTSHCSACLQGYESDSLPEAVLELEKIRKEQACIKAVAQAAANSDQAGLAQGIKDAKALGLGSDPKVAAAEKHLAKLVTLAT